MSKPYKNPPVVEAVFEIRFLAELSIECKKDEYYEKVRKDFPNIFVPVIDGPEPYPLKNYRFETVDKSRIIQFSINRFSYHTKKYETFAEFGKDAEKYTQMFCELYCVSNLKRTGLRYIDHIPIQREEGTIPIAKYLNFGYKLPDSMPPKLELFQTILLTKLNDGKLRILIQVEETKDKGEIIVLDFDFFFEGDLSVADLKRYLDKSHEHTKKVFEGLISDNYRKVMEGED